MKLDNLTHSDYDLNAQFFFDFTRKKNIQKHEANVETSINIRT